MKTTIIAAATMLAASACTTTPEHAAQDTPRGPAASYSAEEEVLLKVIDRFLLAIGNHDAEALDELVIVEGVSWFQHIPPESSGLVEPFLNSDIIEPRPDDSDPFIERYWSPIVHMRAGLAQVWAPYELRDNGRQVHCGINAFDLVYLDDAWRVASLMSTTEPKSCDGFLAVSPAMMRPRDGWKETRNE